MIDYINDTRKDSSIDELTAKKYLARLYPDATTFESALYNMSGRALKNLLPYLIKMIDADGVRKPAEVDLLEKLEGLSREKSKRKARTA